MYVRPWNKESQRILDQLTMDFRAESSNTQLPSIFSSKHPEIVDMGFLDMATTRYRKKQNKSIFQIPKTVRIVPKNGKFFFYKIL